MSSFRLPTLMPDRAEQHTSSTRSNVDAPHTAQARRAFAAAARAREMQHVFAYVARQGPPLHPILDWLARDRAYRSRIGSLTISERDLGRDLRENDGARSITAPEILLLCSRVGRLGELRLRGLSIVAHGPSAAFLPTGPSSIHTLTITLSETDTTLHAVASIATSLPGLTTLQIYAWGGAFDGTDIELMRNITRQRTLSLRTLRIRDCTVNQIEGVNTILGATAHTLQHLSIEMAATPTHCLDRANPDRINLGVLTALEELDIFISIYVHGVWHDIRAHADPVLYMLSNPAPNLQVAHVVFRNVSPTLGAYLTSVANFPIRPLCARLWASGALQYVGLSVGGLEATHAQRSMYWRQISRKSSEWRDVARIYGRCLLFL